MRKAISDLSARPLDGGFIFGIRGRMPWVISRHQLNPKYGTAWQAAVDIAFRKNVFPANKFEKDGHLSYEIEPAAWA